MINMSKTKTLEERARQKVAEEILEERKRLESEQQRLERERQIEYNKVSNRLRRNWYYLSALTIAIISLIIGIWKLWF